MKTKKFTAAMMTLLLMLTLVTVLPLRAFAAENETVQADGAAAGTEEEANENDVTSAKAAAAASCVAIVGAAGAIGMAIAISKSTDCMARQPEIASKINSAMMLGLVFIETVIIYALIVAILVIFVL